MDPLASVIDLLRPRTLLSKRISGAGRWGVRYDAYRDPSFCLMLVGACWLTVEGAAPLRLAAGDFLLMPATPAFALTSDRDMAKEKLPLGPDSTGLRELRHGDPDGEAPVRMIGGFFRFDAGNAALLLDLLPATIHIRSSDPGADRLRQIVRLISDEVDGDAPGRDPILERLAEVLLIEALRWRPGERDLHPHGLLAGLADAQVAVALRRMHGDVAYPWTIVELARDAGMSRASFAERFARTVGMPPMQYLLRWRMALARDMLRHRSGQLEQVAAAIGYQSASAFSTAFSRHMGMPPSAFARIPAMEG
ncbi:AraC family transcriptional regulator [Sphingomonas sp. dw_22]|uniref:AraC family transcriptional regulator n=1 Tax=Sphingomonas sp. dw_22 TaxID=2721175 RepID=UPI001BD6356A|nr:AraC family transcriptional regulator [Sphingomonas sp. dw_22]